MKYYSLNPIEEAFSKIKSEIRRDGHWLWGPKKQPRIFDLYDIVYHVTEENAAGYFVHGGCF